MTERRAGRNQTVASGKDGRSWVSLLTWSTIAAVVVVVLVNVFAGIIPPLLVFAVLWVVGVLWLRRASRGPAILLLVSFVAFLALSGPFIIPTLTVPASAGDFILNVASLIAVLVGLVAAIAVVRGRLGPSPAARSIGLGALGLFVVATAVSVVATVTHDDAVAQEGDVQLVTSDIQFEDTSLAADSGEISVFVDNQDATLHTFTIDELDVDLDIPAASAGRVTFEAEPGRYQFYCVPHEATMKGTLTVR
jgi:plastocyanin